MLTPALSTSGQISIIRYLINSIMRYIMVRVARKTDFAHCGAVKTECASFGGAERSSPIKS